MRALVVFSFLLMAVPVLAQDKLQVLTPDQEPRKVLHRFLIAEAQKHFDARKSLVASLKTPDEIYKRQRDLKAKFIDAKAIPFERADDLGVERRFRVGEAANRVDELRFQVALPFVDFVGRLK